MAKKIKLKVQGLTGSQVQSGAYALILSEVDGPHRIPIIVGMAEAQSIAMALEHLTPPRPLTHDLFVTFTHSFGILLQEVYIYIEGRYLYFRRSVERVWLDIRKELG